MTRLEALSIASETIVTRSLRLFVFASLSLVLLNTPGWSQLTTTGTLNGTVTDASGANVPQAAVTVISEETLTETHTQTNSDGSFVVAGLAPGHYKVTVVKNGFQTFTETGIVLSAAQTATVNASLVVGQVSTTVNVQANAAQIQTSTPEVSSQVNDEQVSTLPLNGRNYQSLSFLMPGVTNLTPDVQQSQGGFNTFNTIAVNGLGVQGTMYYLDGVWNENTGNLNQTTITPNPDTLEEVRLLQNNFSAQYSLNGSTVMLLETKSGTEKFHGAAFEYLRNDALDARNFFSPGGPHAVPALKQNVFGYTLGGPLFIPGHYNTKKDKTFFFVSEQWTDQHLGNTLLAPTPTAAMRAGTFTTSIKDPTTGMPFPQSSPGVYQIPMGRLSTSALALMNAAEPLPNYGAPGAFLNYLNDTPVITRTRIDQFKLDQNIGSKLRVMAEYFDMWQPIDNPDQPNLGIPYNTTQQTDFTHNQMAELRATQLISATMVNTTSLSMNNYIVSLNYTGLIYQSQVPAFQEVLPYHGYLSSRLPTLAFAGGYPVAGVGYPFPLHHGSTLEDTLSDDWSWLRGKHYLRAGVEYLRGTKRQNDFAATAGEWVFTGAFSGNPIADYLLGNATEFLQASSEFQAFNHYHIFSPYVEDQWKISKRLTATLGLRYSYSPPVGYQSDQKGFSTFEPSLYNPANAPTVSTGGVITATPTYNPLNGIAFLGVTPGVPNNYTNKHDNALSPTFGFAYDVFGDGKTSLRGGYGISHTQDFLGSCNYQCVNNYPLTSTLALLSPSFPNPTGATAAPTTVPSLTTDGVDITNPYVETYSLGLQHQFGNWFASVTGAGSQLRKACEVWNVNQPVPEGGFNFNPLINTPSNSRYASSLAGPVPYLGYGSLGLYTCETNAGWNALEVNVKHPVGHDVYFSAAYTWQHGVSMVRGTNGITNGATGPQDIYHPGDNYGDENSTPAQILALSGIWHIPAFRGATGFKKTLLGGWQYSDITSFQSGFPLDPGLSTSTPGLATRPNRVAGTITGPKTVAQWFNTAAFAAPAAGFFGNAAPGSIIGPGSVDFDMALYKDFRIKERSMFEFRAEFFNIFNHTNFNGVSTSFGAGNFGQVTSAADPRIVEFALRYQF